MKKILLIAVLTLIPSFANAAGGDPNDDALVAADCADSQDNATLQNVCNDVSWCGNDSSSDGSRTPQATSTSQKTQIYKNHIYCTRIPFKVDGQSYTYVLCFKDKNLCNQMHCKEGYIGTLPNISDTTFAYGMLGSVTSFNYEIFYTVNVDSTSKQIFNCCSTIELDTYTEVSLPNQCSDSANKVTWYQHNSCTASGASTTTTKKHYLTCKTGYYAAAATANSGKYFITGTGNEANPCNNISKIGCTACPSASDIFSNQAMTTPVTGTTSGYGAAGVTSCYIPATSVGYYDITGKFKTPSNCSFKR